jgi:hypothetical protein
MVFELIINRPYEPLGVTVDKDVAMLIDRMLQKDPTKRPSIWEMAKMPCIEEKIKHFYKEHPQETPEFPISKSETEETKDQQQ